MEITGQLEALSSDINARWDPLPASQSERVDLGWIGEDARGVWLALHPETALINHLDVADLYERQRQHPEITAADRDTLSAWEYTLALEYAAAWSRRTVADAEGRRRG